MATPALLRRFWPYMARYKGILCFDLFCAALTSVCELVLPLIMRSITNMGVNDLSSLTVSYILRVGALYLVLRLIDGAANYFMANTGHVMGARIETDMRTDLFAHLQQLSFSYYNNTKIGQIMGRITSDLFDITEFAHHGPENFFISGIKVLISFIILSGMNVTLTLMIFALHDLLYPLFQPPHARRLQGLPPSGGRNQRAGGGYAAGHPRGQVLCQ